MKKVLPVMMMFMITTMFAIPASADEMEERFKKGLKTFKESRYQMSTALKEEQEKAVFKPFGVVGGILKGSFFMGKEASQGLYQMLIFNSDFLNK